LGYTPETSQKLTISLAPFQRATSDFTGINLDDFPVLFQ
jgi:hypothetical protein